jgi:multiple sugar transport system permease protein
MAASLIMTAPVIVLFFACQRYFIRGIVMSGIKG